MQDEVDHCDIQTSWDKWTATLGNPSGKGGQQSPALKEICSHLKGPRRLPPDSNVGSRLAKHAPNLKTVSDPRPPDAVLRAGNSPASVSRIAAALAQRKRYHRMEPNSRLDTPTGQRRDRSAPPESGGVSASLPFSGGNFSRADRRGRMRLCGSHPSRTMFPPNWPIC